MSGLLKEKQYDWKDTNMSLFGSKVDKLLKKKSAKTEPAWNGIEGKMGTTVWRINVMINI
ncbi:hypothetical protein A3Q56_00337 [Intoshia linei]|uniref:Uncharacterized protein n=1 Tax=Intoshia linei TaxID=1819745 RepID=A0A177BC53_9BILA|nr:hypothetical protein A3Q56_00337 [Intoshia linei]